MWKSSSVPLQSFVSVCFSQLQPQHLCNLRLAIQTYWALVAKFRSQFESKVRDLHHVRFPETDKGHVVAHCWPTTGWRRVHGQAGLQEGCLLELRFGGALATKEPRKGSEGVGGAFGRARLAWVVVGVWGCVGVGSGEEYCDG